MRARARAARINCNGWPAVLLLFTTDYITLHDQMRTDKSNSKSLFLSLNPPSTISEIDNLPGAQYWYCMYGCCGDNADGRGGAELYCTLDNSSFRHCTNNRWRFV